MPHSFQIGHFYVNLFHNYFIETIFINLNQTNISHQQTYILRHER